jgi:hypothetical protein
MRSVSVVLLPLFAEIVTAIVFPSLARSQSGAVTTDELTRSADVVVVGKVTDVKSEWSPDRSRIYSTVTLAVDQHIKGDESQQSVIISTLGGEVDGVGEVYSHTAKFKIDEQVIVFASKDRQGQLKVIGGDEGKLTVTKEEETGRMLVGGNEPLTIVTSHLKAVVQAQARKE